MGFLRQWMLVNNGFHTDPSLNCYLIQHIHIRVMNTNIATTVQMLIGHRVLELDL